MDCDNICSLAWLLRNDMRHLFMDKAYVGHCANGTQFYQLQPNSLSHCPGWEDDLISP